MPNDSAQAVVDEVAKKVDRDEVRWDAFQNPFTGVGTSRDSRNSTKYALSRRIPDGELAAVYDSNGIARRVVDLAANDMTRNWFEVTGDEDDMVLQKLEELSGQRRVCDGVRYGRLFGGAIVLMGIQDGKDLTEPVNEDTIQDVTSLTVYDKRELVVQDSYLQKDLSKPNFGEPEWYDIIPLLGGPTVQVHASRVLRFDGNHVAREEYIRNQYWHDSILQSAYEHLRQLGAVFDSAELIVQDFVVTVFKLKGLMTQLRSTEGRTELKHRADSMDKSRHVQNSIFIDSEDDLIKHAASVAGLQDLLDRFMMGLSSSTYYPVTLLMGRSPSGMDATGESDIQFYYDHIKSEQRNELKPPLETLVKYIFLANGKEPEKWSIKFKPLFDPTPDQVAELYKRTAEGDQIYINARVADEFEIEQHRFGGQEFNPSPPVYEVQEREEPEPGVVPPEVLAAQQAMAAGRGGVVPQAGDEDPEAGEGDDAGDEE
jgi:phage-related protein (TIGR01555 family)